MTKTKTSEGRPWTAAGFYDTYNLAEKKSNQIKLNK